MQKFKIRCSAIGNIMGENGLTDKQLLTIKDLEAKEKITTKQSETLNALKLKRDNPELPEGAKTYCKDWLKGQIYDFRKEISNKYLDKGNIMEDEAADFIADQLNYGFLIINREEHFSDDYMRGTPDIILKDVIIDVKNSWSADTFPLFEEVIPNKGYYWQLQGYMSLTGRSKAKLIYCLMDTPLHLIEKEARWDSIRQGYEELEKHVYDKHVQNLTYSNVDNKYKIKVYDIERNDSDIEKIKNRVIECRNYIDKLKETIA